MLGSSGSTPVHLHASMSRVARCYRSNLIAPFLPSTPLPPSLHSEAFVNYTAYFIVTHTGRKGASVPEASLSRRCIKQMGDFSNLGDLYLEEGIWEWEKHHNSTQVLMSSRVLFQDDRLRNRAVLWKAVEKKDDGELSHLLTITPGGECITVNERLRNVLFTGTNAHLLE